MLYTRLEGLAKSTTLPTLPCSCYQMKLAGSRARYWVQMVGCLACGNFRPAATTWDTPAVALVRATAYRRDHPTSAYRNPINGPITRCRLNTDTLSKEYQGQDGVSRPAENRLHTPDISGTMGLIDTVNSSSIHGIPANVQGQRDR